MKDFRVEWRSKNSFCPPVVSGSIFHIRVIFK
jgi:hypothetical protein